MSRGPKSNLKYGWLNIKTLIFAKIILLGIIGLVVSNQLEFGEKDVSAQDGAKKDEKKASETAKEKTDSTPQEQGAEEASQKEADEEEGEEGDSPGSSRRSFLDGLLKLPEIDKTKPTREEIGRFLDLAEQKQRQVESRLEMLKLREGHLTQLEVLVEDKIKVLEEERVLFQQSIQSEKTLSEDRVAQLIDFYKKMDAKKAAPVLEKLDKDLVVSLFKGIPQKQITKLLAAMTPERSVEITEYFGRVRSGREYDMLKEMNQFLVDKFQDCKGLPSATH